MDAQRHAGVDDRAQREHADGSNEPGKGHSFVIISGSTRGESRHSSPCPSMTSRSRSRGCPSSPACICGAMRRARRSTSARPARCATASAAISGAYGLSPRHDALLEEITRVEVIVTDSVMEALALENNLIKQRSPKYNILLRDDKNYPYLQLTTSEAFPRVLVARSVEKTGDYYAGPFLPAKLARRTMALSHRLFGIRSCNETITGSRARPCLEYDIKRCIAPCVREICSEEQYGVAVTNTRLLLEGRNDELIETLRLRMVDAAGGERFEEAAQLRDAMRTVQTLRDRQQKVATAQLGDRDVFGLKVGPSGSALQIFAMRGGRVVERVELVTDPGAVDRRHRRAPGGPGAVLRLAHAAVRDQSAGGDRGRRRDGGVAVGARRPPRQDSRAAAWRQAGAGRPGDAQRRARRIARASTRSRRRTSTRSRRCARSSGCRRCRAGSSASTSRRSRAARPWRRWSSAKTAG